MGQWRLVVIILSLYKTNDWIPVGVYTTKIITSPVNAFTVLTWRTCISKAAIQVELLRRYFSGHDSDSSYISSML